MQIRPCFSRIVTFRPSGGQDSILATRGLDSGVVGRTITGAARRPDPLDAQSARCLFPAFGGTEETLRLFVPGLADELVWREGLESSANVIIELERAAVDLKVFEFPRSF